jgi:PadR family transcriptional regulator, regulatory protein PadR
LWPPDARSPPNSCRGRSSNPSRRRAVYFSDIVGEIVSNGLGEFEQLVLLALMRLEPEAYGVAIRDEIEKRTGRSVALGAVYTTLLRLEDKRLVATRLGDPTPQRGGRRKKYYRPLAAGRRELVTSLEAIRSMTHGLKPGFELP